MLTAEKRKEVAISLLFLLGNGKKAACFAEQPQRRLLLFCLPITGNLCAYKLGVTVNVRISHHPQ